MPWRLGTSSQLQMIADDLVIAKIPSFSTVMAFDGWNLLQQHVHALKDLVQSFFGTEFQKLKPKKTQNQGNLSKLKDFFLQKLKDDVISL